MFYQPACHAAQPLAGKTIQFRVDSGLPVTHSERREIQPGKGFDGQDDSGMAHGFFRLYSLDGAHMLIRYFCWIRFS